MLTIRDPVSEYDSNFKALSTLNKNLFQNFFYSDKHLDAAPFQLVRKTSLHKIHSIFSMLQLNKVLKLTDTVLFYFLWIKKIME